MALQHGADAVYLGLRDATNARNFGGLNFTEADIRTGVAEAHARGAEVLFAINTFAQMGAVAQWQRAVVGGFALRIDQDAAVVDRARCDSVLDVADQAGAVAEHVLRGEHRFEPAAAQNEVVVEKE